jgi:DNA-binding transcriptional ArsR family regulator
MFDKRRTMEGMGLIRQNTEAAEIAVAIEPLPHPGREQIELGPVLHALSDPMRLRIVAALANGEERSCKSIDLPVVKSTCTHHFRVLREAGVIHQRQEGTARLNSLRRAELEGRFPGLLDAVLRAADHRKQRPPDQTHFS